MDIKNLSVPIRYELLDNDDRFLKCKLYVMHDGLNLNNSSFSLTSIENAKESIKNIPILAFIKDEDFAGHEFQIIVEENDVKVKYLGRPIGVIPENCNYHYKELDGKTYVVVEGYLWKNYMNEALDIFERDQVKSVSMEIVVDDGEWVDDGYYNITKYRYTGVCVLGDDVIPAMEGAKIEIIKNQNSNFGAMFAQMIDELTEYLKQQQTIDIDNSKESANMKGSWGDVDKTELRNKIMAASNYKELAKECYLILEDGWEDAPSEHLKYPHHQIVDGKLVVHKDGCQTALAYCHKEGIFEGEAIEHLKRHYKELELSLDAFTISELNVKVDNLQNENQKLQVQLEELRKLYEEKLSLIEKYENEINVLKQEKLALEEFKNQKIKEEKLQQIEELFSKFEGILENLDELKEKAIDMDLAEVEKQLYALLGQKMYSKVITQDNKIIKMGIDNIDDKNKNKKGYEHIIEKYAQK